MTSPSGLQMAPVSYHMTKHMPFTLVPRVVANIDDEQTALYVHAVFGLREPEVGKQTVTLAKRFLATRVAIWSDMGQYDY